VADPAVANLHPFRLGTGDRTPLAAMAFDYPFCPDVSMMTRFGCGLLRLPALPAA
jgi:hypothetical protein